MTPAELKATQAAYAARPFAVRWVDSHVATCNRFHTFDEAHQYAQDMWAMIRREVATRHNMESHLWQSFIETPQGRIALRWYVLADDVSSYYRA
jgi:hypothetical protein